MKKIIIILVTFVFIGEYSYSQVLTNKQGIPILPKTGDIAIGISATPILNFIGNATKINSASTFNNPASWDFIDGNNTIYAKYYIDDKTAVRVKLRLYNSSTNETKYSVKNQIADSIHTINQNTTVEDTWKHSESNFLLSFGLEKHRGYGRLQGYYGAEISLGLVGKEKDTYEYGNAIDSTFQQPDRNNFDQNPGPPYVTSVKRSAIFSAGIGGFVGVEYFILPKISIGGEFFWGISINPSNNSYGETETVEEYWGTTPGSTSTRKSLQTITQYSGKQHSTDLDNTSTGGSIFLLFYF